MAGITKGYQRITVSLPKNTSTEIDQLTGELHLSRSELFKRALERFLADHRRQKLAQVSAMMASEYESNDELTAFSTLDGEDFK